MSVSEALSPPPFSLWDVAGTFEKMVHHILQEIMKAFQWDRSMAVLVPAPACSTSPGDELTPPVTWRHLTLRDGSHLWSLILGEEKLLLLTVVRSLEQAQNVPCGLK